MTSGKKKRLSMLDSIASASASGAAPSPAPSAPSTMMSAHRALRSARDVVDAHHVWELDPADIIDDRMSDRLDPADVIDLRDAIEANGQTVPILVRRHPEKDGRYLLVYGRRRLEAIRGSDKVGKIRALVASMDDDSALRAQISENMARRDLSFIEKALFARELIAGGFGNQSQVAEVLTVTKSSVSMALAVVDMVGADLIRSIGSAHGIGRPKWETLGKAIDANGLDSAPLIRIAEKVHDKVAVDMVVEDAVPAQDASVLAFQAVFDHVARVTRPDRPSTAPPAPPAATTLRFGGGHMKRTGKGLSITLDNSAFADWVETQADNLMDELHARWKQQAED